MYKSILIVVLCIATSVSFAQSITKQINIVSDGNAERLVTGGVASTGFYDESIIRHVVLVFTDPNYTTTLANNYSTDVLIPAMMIVDGDTLPTTVGVKYKGNTSYFQTGMSLKKSFAIKTDEYDGNQEIMGYNNLNFQNSYFDDAMMREVLYNNINRDNIPGPQSSFITLEVNGIDYGLYQNVQQINGDFLKEWFLSNDGTNWRCVKPGGGIGGPGGPGPGGPFGTGYSSLNWLGNDTTDYQDYYELKRWNKTNPWDDLVNVCDVLNNTTAAQLETEINKVMDLDRVLWTLATEIAFSDDDSYIYKGGMDYYAYWEKETERMTILEYDGNTVMDLSNVNWSAFYNENDTRYALLNKLLAVPEIRQRYLAHMRVIIDDKLNSAAIDAKIDAYALQIDALVNADPIKYGSYNDFINGVTDLKTFVTNRRTFLNSNAEVSSVALSIGNVIFSTNSIDWEQPTFNDDVDVRVTISGSQGVNAINLYYSNALVGIFDKVTMLDDGLNNDGAANDGVFGGSIPAHNAGSYVRYYVEAIANDAAKTAAYKPKGAEHDVYIYQVQLSDVVINELMADNDNVVADQDGEFDDWLEIYNNGSATVDLSGYYLSDDEMDLTQWTFPSGTSIAVDGYITVWCDGDTTQSGLHTNFGLGKNGETVFLSNPAGVVVDQVTFPEQTTDVSYARRPNGVGAFVKQNETFGSNNDLAVGIFPRAQFANNITMYPNPSSDIVNIELEENGEQLLQIFDVTGRLVHETTINKKAVVNTNTWSAGVYMVRVNSQIGKLVVN